MSSSHPLSQRTPTWPRSWAMLRPLSQVMRVTPRRHATQLPCWLRGGGGCLKAWQLQQLLQLSFA
jgi:hypothetical protein